jgi:hypothetical protein
MNQKSDAKIRRFGTEYKYLDGFFIRLLRQIDRFATKRRCGHLFVRKKQKEEREDCSSLSVYCT